MEDILLPKEDLWCYRLDPAPPKWELQEYIAAFGKERNTQYFAWFLSYYESSLNKKIESIMIRYFMPGHFPDLKQAYVTGPWKALENYDISHGVPFLIYKERYVEREVLDYIRTARTGYTAQSMAEYDKLRKTMAIWTEKYNRRTDEATLNALAAEIGESVQNIAEILEGGIRNENAVALYHRYADDDSEKTLLEVVPDPNSDPAFLFQRSERNTRLWDAFDKLDYEEQAMLAKHFGFCLNCHSTVFMDIYDPDTHGKPKKKPIPRMRYTDIATEHGYSSANTVKRKCDRALEKLKKAMK